MILFVALLAPLLCARGDHSWNTRMETNVRENRKRDIVSISTARHQKGRSEIPPTSKQDGENKSTTTQKTLPSAKIETLKTEPSYLPRT